MTLTLIIISYRQMAHDEDVYPDPFVFRPERFLDENGHVPEPDSRAVAFGFGRRWVQVSRLSQVHLFLTHMKDLPWKGAWGKHSVYRGRDDSSYVQYHESEGREGPRNRACTWVCGRLAQVWCLFSVLWYVPLTFLSRYFSHPKPFECSITPRSEKAKTLINSIVEEHPFERGDGDILTSLTWWYRKR